MPPAAADQFFTSRASSLMHSNNNNNNDNDTNTNTNNNTERRKLTTPTTLKTLINYNNNNNSNCVQDSRSSSVKSSKSVGCGSCFRYQREQDLLRQPSKEEAKNFDLVHGDFKESMTAVSSDMDCQNSILSGDGAHHSSKSKSNTHRTPSCTNVVNRLSHSYCKYINHLANVLEGIGVFIFSTFNFNVY